MTAQPKSGPVLSKCCVPLVAIAVGLAGSGCGGSGDDGNRELSATGGNGATTGGTGGSDTPPSDTGGTQTGGTPTTGGQIGVGGSTTQTGGQVGVGGGTPTGGQSPTGTGGSSPTGGSSGTGGQPGTGGSTGDGGQPPTTGGSGGAAAGAGGQPAGGTGANAGASATGGAAGGGDTGGPCVPTQEWGTANPAQPGPFEIVVENNIGPAAGIPDDRWDGEIPHFNLYRPADLSQGYCHPIVTWANGTGDQPPTYEVLIKQLATHGFVVVASLSSQTAQGDPLPQIAGIDWMIEENENPDSPLYHHLDIAHIGATGHSQGGAATTMAGEDPRITAIAPICGARGNVTLHGPAALLCGGSDDMVPCSSVEQAYNTINDVPVMLFNSLSDTHGSWIGSIQNPFMVAVTGWMRVHLMGDTANRGMFYGSECSMCSDSRVSIQRKGMDE